MPSAMILKGFCPSKAASCLTVVRSGTERSPLFAIASIKSLQPFGSRYPRSKCSKLITDSNYHKTGPQNITTKDTNERHSPVPEFQVDVVAGHLVDGLPATRLIVTNILKLFRPSSRRKF